MTCRDTLNHVQMSDSEDTLRRRCSLRLRRPGDLGHDFHQTPQRIRCTISEPARGEVLARLLALNHERYEQEVKAGLHEKKWKGKNGSTVTETGGRER